MPAGRGAGRGAAGRVWPPAATAAGRGGVPAAAGRGAQGRGSSSIRRSKNFSTFEVESECYCLDAIIIIILIFEIDYLLLYFILYRVAGFGATSAANWRGHVGTVVDFLQILNACQLGASRCRISSSKIQSFEKSSKTYWRS
jgi:hypothetical protein